MPELGPTLHAHNRLVTSPFGLLGTDENALSFALGYSFQQCPHLLQWFLCEIGLPGIRLSSLQRTRIDLQRYRSDTSGVGITDLEIHLPGHFHVIIEAKVGLGVPSLPQCEKYLRRLASANEPIQRLIALVQSPDLSIEEAYGKISSSLKGKLMCFHWSYFITECVRLITRGRVSADALQAVRWFYRFLDEEYRMKAFTTEVWILPIATQPLWSGGLSFLDIHQKYLIYFDNRSPTVRPLYIGLRSGGQLDSLHRVIRIEHETPVSKYVPNLQTPWKDTPHTIWHLDKAVPLPRTIPTGGKLWQRRVPCDFDVLLSAKTVMEIEDTMRERKRQAPSNLAVSK